jgi:hypothetical protein
LAPRWCAMGLIGAAWPEAMEHEKRWEQGQIEEGTTTDSPMRSAVLHSDFPTMLKGGTGAAWHGRAPRLVGWAREVVG